MIGAINWRAFLWGGAGMLVAYAAVSLLYHMYLDHLQVHAIVGYLNQAAAEGAPQP